MSELIGPLPVTGELVDGADLPAVTRSLSELKDLRNAANEAIRALTDVLCEVSAETGESTFDIGGFTVRLSSAEETIYDLEQMRELLSEVGLPDHRLDELLEPVTTYELNGNVRRQLAGANPIYRAIIEECTSKQPKTRYATIIKKP